MKYRVAAYILFLFILAEGTLRLGFMVVYSTPFLKPGELIYRYYPLVKHIKRKYVEADKGTYKILILSCSTLHKEWAGDFETIMEKNLGHSDSIGHQPYAVFNASGIGFSSADNLNCYRLLDDLNFDVVVNYGGINDSRFNNCPAEVFKEDYSHIAWNNEINCVLRHSEMNAVLTPFFVDYSFERIRQLVCKQNFILAHYSFAKDWWNFGNELKSLPCFKRNTATIAADCKQKKEELLLMSYAYYLPPNYSLDRFENRQLDYTFQPNSRETEIWGKAQNVSSFLDSSNAAMKVIAETTRCNFFDMHKRIGTVHTSYADVCHFSSTGLAVFSNALTEQIQKIKYGQ